MSSVTDIRPSPVAVKGLTLEQHKLVLGEMPHIRRLTRKLQRVLYWVPPEDIEQVVGVGYCEAAIDGDPTMPKKAWSHYAYIRAHGKAIDTFLRDSPRRQMALARRAFAEVAETFRPVDDPWASDEEILSPLAAVCGEGTFRVFFGRTFETWRYQGEQGVVNHLDRLNAFRALQSAFSSLTEDEWRLYELYYIECKTWAEVGAELGVQERQAKNRADAVYGKLRRELASRGVRKAPPEAL